jgi:1-hydroxycarotenoid 3,4-desaturase
MTTVIIGAGIGGLAAAITLASTGEKVKVFDKQPGAGGKLLPWIVNDEAYDAGPTVLTMRWVFEHLFERAGQSLADRLQLSPLDILVRNVWSGGQRLDLFADKRQREDAIGSFAGNRELQGYKAFAAEASRIHNSLIEPFIKSQRPTPWGLTKSMSFNSVLSINPFEGLWRALGRHFHDPRLKQLFGRYATYCGTSPFKAPATLMLVADVEAQGVWRAKGGMAAVAKAVETLARDSGVEFHFSTQVQTIETAGNRVSAVIDGNGSRHTCDSAIVNADSEAVAMGLLGASIRHTVSSQSVSARSYSAIICCMKCEASGMQLDHHNVFFSNNYEREFEDLELGPAKDPTVYLCDQGEGRKFLLINAPANAQPTPKDIQELINRRLHDCGLSLSWPSAPAMRGPHDFSRLFPGTSGALYGRASNGWTSTFLRPQARTKVSGLYLAGGSIHPGPGVPMAALSGLRAAEASLQDRVSTRRLHPVVTAGGTSTH